MFKFIKEWRAKRMHRKISRLMENLKRLHGVAKNDKDIFMPTGAYEEHEGFFVKLYKKAPMYTQEQMDAAKEAIVYLSGEIEELKKKYGSLIS